MLISACPNSNLNTVTGQGKQTCMLKVGVITRHQLGKWWMNQSINDAVAHPVKFELKQILDIKSMGHLRSNVTVPACIYYILWPGNISWKQQTKREQRSVHIIRWHTPHWLAVFIGPTDVYGHWHQAPAFVYETWTSPLVFAEWGILIWYIKGETLSVPF